MKLINLSFVVFLMIQFISCAKEARVYERIPLDNVKMETFGFYEEDNQGIILQDYVVKNISSNRFSVALPEDVDRSRLVARFTLSNQNIARVEGILQKSGETINDFSIPLDYILSYGNNNVKYTVQIEKAPNFIWKPILFTYNDSAVSMILKVNPITEAPHILFTQSRPNSADQKAALLTYEKDAWVFKGEVSDGRVGSYYDMTFNSTGVPYVSFLDYTASIAQLNTVKKFSGGTNWELVGPKGVTTARASYNALTFVNDSKLMLFSTMDVAGVLARRELGISVFENNAWSTNNAIPGRPSSLFGYFPTVRIKNGIVYLAVFNASSPNSVSIYKFENNVWTNLVDQWRDVNATAMNIRDFDMEVDPQGNVFVAFADNSNGAAYKYRVIKYTAETQVVSPVGSYITGASGNLFSFDLAISPLGTPYLLHRNASNFPTLVSFDKDRKDWSNPYVFEPEVADELNMEFTSNGEAFVTYLKNRKIYVQKYEAP